MTVYLVDHPPRIRQYRSPRRQKPSGVCVVHTAESYPDETGPDTGAENVAAFIRDRTNYGSYHDLADSDSIIQLVPYSAEAFHDATGSNPHSYGVSAATQAARWPSLGEAWVEATVTNMAAAAARYARWIKTEHNVIIPAKRRTRAETEARWPGFISHGERDPGRRTDPGSRFPWDLFLGTYADLMGSADEPPAPTPADWEDNVHLSRYGSSQYVLVTDSYAPIRIDVSSYNELRKYGVPVRTLSNAAIEILDRCLPTAPDGESIEHAVMRYKNERFGDQDVFARIREIQSNVAA